MGGGDAHRYTWLQDHRIQGWTHVLVLETERVFECGRGFPGLTDGPAAVWLVNQTDPSLGFVVDSFSCRSGSRGAESESLCHQRPLSALVSKMTSFEGPRRHQAPFGHDLRGAALDVHFRRTVIAYSPIRHATNWVATSGSALGIGTASCGLAPRRTSDRSDDREFRLSHRSLTQELLVRKYRCLRSGCWRGPVTNEPL